MTKSSLVLLGEWESRSWGQHWNVILLWRQRWEFVQKMPTTCYVWPAIRSLNSVISPRKVERGGKNKNQTILLFAAMNCPSNTVAVACYTNLDWEVIVWQPVFAMCLIILKFITLFDLLEIKDLGAEGSDQWPKVLAALPEELCLNGSTHIRWLTAIRD